MQPDRVSRSSETIDRSEPRTRYGVTLSGGAWVNHGDTRYAVTPKPGVHEVGMDDLDVVCESGPDVLDHAEVRWCALDAMCDAYGSL